MSHKFNLKWNEFQNNINVAFKALRLERDFSDVTLACDDDGGSSGKEIEAHKLILAASSPFFQQLLRENKLMKQPLVLIKGVSQVNLVAMVDFLYHGEVNVLQENLEAFLELSEELQLKGLIRSSKGKEQIKRNIFVEIKENYCNTIGVTNKQKDENEDKSDENENEEDETSDVETIDESIDDDEIMLNTHIYFDDEITDDQTLQTQTVDEICNGAESDDENTVGDDKNMQEDAIEDENNTSNLDDSKLNEESHESVTQYENAFESYILDSKRTIQEFSPTSTVEDELVSNFVGNFPEGDIMLNHDAKIKSMMEKGQNYLSNGKRRALAQICKVCGKEGLGKNIQDHIESKHIDGIMLPCYHCEKTFTSRNGLRLHKKKMHGDLNATQSTGELIDSLRKEEEKLILKLDVAESNDTTPSTAESDGTLVTSQIPKPTCFSSEALSDLVEEMADDVKGEAAAAKMELDEELAAAT